MNWLENLPSGAWVVVGAVISLLGTFLMEAWRAHRETRTRAERVADRTRDERRDVYGEVLVSARHAEGEIRRRINELVFHNDYVKWGIEAYDRIWDIVTGDFSERSSRARLVASLPVRTQLEAVSSYFSKGVIALTESDTAWSNGQVSPVRVLEELLVFELEYRNGPEVKNHRDVDRAVEAKRQDLVHQARADEA